MIFAKPVFATCPVCIVAVGGGLWIAEKLGIDDLIAAVWIGALITAMAIWFADRFRLAKLPKPKIVWSIIFYLLTIAFLDAQGKINNPYCKIWGICKIWLGITLGTVFFWLSVFLDQFLRKKNQGKVFFPFQKVIIPLVAIIILSLTLFLTVC